jgi:hypothetical protein
MTMTVEQIEEWFEAASSCVGTAEHDRGDTEDSEAFRKSFALVKAITIRGLATMPRPIEGIPKSDNWIYPDYFYAFHPRQKVWCLAFWDGDIHAKKPRPYINYSGHRTTDSRESQPTLFIPLSALESKTP